MYYLTGLLPSCGEPQFLILLLLFDVVSIIFVASHRLTNCAGLESTMATANPSPQFRILYFAAASSFTGKAEEYLPAPLDATKLFDVLEERYAGIKERVLSSCLVAVNLDYIDIAVDQSENKSDGSSVERGQGKPRVMIKADDEVAIIPPVSSG